MFVTAHVPSCLTVFSMQSSPDGRPCNCDVCLCIFDVCLCSFDVCLCIFDAASYSEWRLYVFCVLVWPLNDPRNDYYICFSSEYTLDDCAVQ